MWLLSTDRAELHYFPSPEAVKDGYVALSHTWDEAGEQSFKDVQKIKKRCEKDGTNPRDLVCEKIRRCCELAEKYGYDWVWIDTCCIDKTSSTELSEAINSMFRYYSLARICFGYLRDVPYIPDLPGRRSPLPTRRHNNFRGPSDLYAPMAHSGRAYHLLKRQPLSARHRLDDPAAKFPTAKWFTRGWTLQELIAPRLFIFLSQEWQVLGSKADLAAHVSRITCIPQAVLRLETSHTQFSIAERMSWFGKRETTRLEDEAYCLLGLFDIHMPPLYGEGRYAFRRLQEEILKRSPDTTLFAWPGSEENHQHPFAQTPKAFDASLHLPIPYFRTRSTGQSPTDTVHKPEGSRSVQTELMSFSVTPHGLLAYVPIVVWENDVHADLGWMTHDSDTPPRHHALLCLEAANSGSEEVVNPSPVTENADGLAHAESRAVGSSLRAWYRIRYPRVTYFSEEGLRLAHTSWQEVLILDSLQAGEPLLMAESPYKVHVPTPISAFPPFRLDPRMLKPDRLTALQLVEVRNLWFTQLNPDSVLPALFRLRRRLYPDDPGAVIRVGRCEHWPEHPIWATVDVEPDDETLPCSPEHDCDRDHVGRWTCTVEKSFQKTFTLTLFSYMRTWPDLMTVTVSFAPCAVHPERTLVLYVSSSYSVDEELSKGGYDDGVDWGAAGATVPCSSCPSSTHTSFEACPSDTDTPGNTCEQQQDGSPMPESETGSVPDALVDEDKLSSVSLPTSSSSQVDMIAGHDDSVAVEHGTNSRPGSP